MNNMRLARMTADMLQAKEKPQVKTDEEEEVIDNFLDAMRPTRGELEALFYDDLPEERQQKIDAIMKEREMAAAIDEAIEESGYDD